MEVCGHWSLAVQRGQLVVRFGLLGFAPPESDVVVGHVGRAIWVEAREKSLVRWTWVVAGSWSQLGYGEVVHSRRVGSGEWVYPHQMDWPGGDVVGWLD